MLHPPPRSPVRVGSVILGEGSTSPSRCRIHRKESAQATSAMRSTAKGYITIINGKLFYHQMFMLYITCLPCGCAVGCKTVSSVRVQSGTAAGLLDNMRWGGWSRDSDNSTMRWISGVSEGGKSLNLAFCTLNKPFGRRPLA